jgi:hypothetical protein
MRYLFAVLGIAVAVVGFGPRAQAQNYPWCEYLSGGEGGGGGKNCGFVSFEQCMESARGNGNDCRKNTMYEPPPGGHANTGAVVVPHHHHAKRTTHKSSRQ